MSHVFAHISVIPHGPWWKRMVTLQFLNRNHICTRALWEHRRQEGRSPPVKKTNTTIPNSLLRSQRILHYWTQSQVAEKIGTTTVNVNRWESGVTSPGLYFRQKLCELFEMSPEELVLVADTNEPPTEITSPVVFLASSYADAEKEPVMHLKTVLQNQE